ncbi:MAG TPA: heavy metal translocating P-type ATPase [candidate division Zixibacteria bacterium]|nr:heavy metal translocating P-type ATPase [candidate division Zixibacteria bacterium]
MAMNTELSLKIGGMHCASCVNTIERALSAMPGVKDCRVNLAMNSAVVAFDSGKASQQGIIDKVAELGFSASMGTPDILTSNASELQAARNRFMMALYVTLPLIALSLFSAIFERFLVGRVTDSIIQGVVASVVLFWAGRGILRDALLQAKHARANMNTLIALGTITAYGWSVYAIVRTILGKPEPLYFDSSAMIITLILLGRFLEARSKGKAGEAIQALLSLAPARALVAINGTELEIDAQTVAPGMELIVRPGERLAADGTIVQGTPVIDESMLTGESVPVEKKIGDVVLGGSLNGNAPFRAKITAAGNASFLASIIRLVSDAQGKKAPVQKLADVVASVFVPSVIGLAFLTLIVWYLAAPDSPMLIKSVISVLIIACPCALGLATPTAILAGTGRAAREGIIIRGGDVLQRLSEIDTVVFDKTGTITHGRMQVVGVEAFAGMNPSSLVRLVGSAEIQSEHPLAKAIVRYMNEQHLEKTDVIDVEALPGIGLKGKHENRELLIGNAALMKKQKVDYGAASEASDREMKKGRTVIFASLDGRVVGILALADAIRSEAKDVIASLKNRTRHITMLSGDNYRTAGGVAKAIGIEAFEAEVQPSQKQTIVESLRKSGGRVAMVGDGINDAPALAAADVGIALGSGTDVAMEAADVVLVRSDMRAVLRTLNVSRQTMRVIRQNLFWAFIYNILAIPIAAGLFYPAFGWTLSPMVAAGAMAFSSVFVVSNSLRLNRLDLKLVQS